MMRVLVAMSGGVDSSVAAALLIEAGHDVAGATLRLWGGTSDSGCCSVADVDDARRVAQQLGIDHFVFNFSDEFDAHVVVPYVEAHLEGRTPNPCIECNRHVKFDLFAARAWRLGFDAIATGHHVRTTTLPDGTVALSRAADGEKDQSYVVHMIGQSILKRCLFPVGDRPKSEIREIARRLDLRTADKAESMDVCFIAKTDGGRRTFLGNRIPLRSGRIVDLEGKSVGTTDAIELVTVGQRRGLGQLGAAEPRFVLDVDMATSTVTIGTAEQLLTDHVDLGSVVISVPKPWAVGEQLTAQLSAHGRPLLVTADESLSRIEFAEPHRRVARGQTVVLYLGDVVVAGGIVQ